MKAVAQRRNFETFAAEPRNFFYSPVTLGETVFFYSLRLARPSIRYYYFFGNVKYHNRVRQNNRSVRLLLDGRS